MRRALAALAVVVALGAGVAFWLSRPQPLPDGMFAGMDGDAEAGAAVFWAGGCASCHAAEGAEGDALLVLAGGRRLDSDFGSFVAPNISTDSTHGIGGWSLTDFANAMLRGISPEGRHYYPSFPYTAYARVAVQDVADLKAFMDTLPADATPSRPHDLTFPFSLRRGIGLWKRLYLTDDWQVAQVEGAAAERGRYLSEALAHCGECHTPRDRLGGLQADRWLAGAPNPSGSGRIPDITPAALSWSEDEIAGYLASGFTPSFDTVGGSMVHVVNSLSRLPGADRRAIAAYLTQVPAPR